ncbi:hypothetical protein [Rhodomicrobium vannielii]|uniref:hypothetical protein n=1 Tax=Rhodomicrobium vannielii TaxID=1069 RepID=UPI0002F6EC87|nr:hypothetical protein [Rhodomicrobium vannielii]
MSSHRHLKGRTILYRPKTDFVDAMTEALSLQLLHHWMAREPRPFRVLASPTLEEFTAATRHIYRTPDERQRHWQSFFTQRLHSAPGKLQSLVQFHPALAEAAVSRPQLWRIVAHCSAFPTPLTWRLMDQPLQEIYIARMPYGMMDIGVQTEITARLHKGVERLDYRFATLDENAR